MVPAPAQGPDALVQADERLIRQKLNTARTESASFLVQMQEAEKTAGESPSAYLKYLEANLEHQMRTEAILSLEAGKAYLVRVGRGPGLFGRTPYLKYSTDRKIGSVRAEVAVPMATDGLVAAMERAINAEREKIVLGYVAIHNAKSLEERSAAEQSWKSGKGLPGLARSIEIMVGHRLKWMDSSILELGR